MEALAIFPRLENLSGRFSQTIACCLSYLEDLGLQFGCLTPNETFYVRNRLWVPEIDEPKYTSVIGLYNGTEKEYTLWDLTE